MKLKKMVKFFDCLLYKLFCFSIIALLTAYGYYREYYVFASFILLFFSAVLAGFFILKHKKKIFQKWLSPFINKECELNLIKIFFISLLSVIIIANFFFFYFKFYTSINFLSAEFSLVGKLTKILSFYFFFGLLVKSLGDKMLLSAKITERSLQKNFLLSIALGFTPIMLGLFLLSVLQILFWWSVVLLVLFLGTFSWRHILQNIRLLKKYKISLSTKNYFSSWKSLVFFCIFILLSLQFITITKPIPITTDDLHTYWNAPLEYSHNHGYMAMRNSKTASMGQNTEMIYSGIITALGTEYAIHFQFFSFILLLFGIYAFTKKIINKKTALLSLVFVYLIPWNTYYLSTLKVEHFLSFYLIVILMAVYDIIQTKNTKHIFLLGVLSGVALGIKYTSAFLIIPIYLIIFFFCLKNKKTLFAFIFSSLLLIMFFSPWLLKNYIYFDNPVYPYKINKQSDKNSYLTFNRYFRKERSKEINTLRHSNNGHNKFGLLINQSIGKNIDKGQWINYGFFSPLLLLFMLFLFRKNEKKFYLSTIASIYFLLWLFIEGSRPWYAMFGYILIYILASLLIYKNKFLTYLTIVMMFIFFVVNISFYSINFQYLFGKIGKEQYTEEAIPYYETAQFINKINISSNEKILIVGDFRTALINKNGLFVITDPYLNKLSYSLNQGDDYFLQDLKNNSINFIVYSKIVDDLYLNWPKSNYNISLSTYLSSYQGNIPSIFEDITSLKKFLEINTTELYNDNYYYLYKINK